MGDSHAAKVERGSLQKGQAGSTMKVFSSDSVGATNVQSGMSPGHARDVTFRKDVTHIHTQKLPVTALHGSELWMPKHTHTHVSTHTHIHTQAHIPHLEK